MAETLGTLISMVTGGVVGAAAPFVGYTSPNRKIIALILTIIVFLTVLEGVVAGISAAAGLTIATIILMMIGFPAGRWIRNS